MAVEFTNNNIWYEFFESFASYLKEILYDYNETNLEVIRIIPTINSETFINENIIGYTYVEDEKNIYDQDSVLIQTLIKKDKFHNTEENQDYFICDFDDTLHPISDKYNNTRIGNHGIYLGIGDVILNSDEPIAMNEIPQIKLQMQKTDTINMLEMTRVHNDKDLNFGIIITVSETDINTPVGKTGYKETDRVLSLVCEWIRDYKLCSTIGHLDGFTNRISNWTGSFEMLAEQNRDLMRISAISNIITFE